MLLFSFSVHFYMKVWRSTNLEPKTWGLSWRSIQVTELQEAQFTGWLRWQSKGSYHNFVWWNFLNIESHWFLSCYLNVVVEWPFFDYMVLFCMCAPVPCDAFKIHYVLVLFMTQRKKNLCSCTMAMKIQYIQLLFISFLLLFELGRFRWLLTSDKKRVMLVMKTCSNFNTILGFFD